MNSVSRNVVASCILSLAVAAPLLLSGCGGGEDLAPCTCAYQGETYEIGESFAAADDCNTCVCGADGAVSCTKMACPAVTCSHKGAMYQVGQGFPAGDGLNTCVCAADGSVVCTGKVPAVQHPPLLQQQ